MMGVRPRSPGAYPAPWSTPQPGLEDHAGPETRAGPVLEDSADLLAAPAFTSIVILSEGCALQLPLDGFNLVVEAMPDSVLQVTLQDHTLIVGPHSLLGSTDQGSGEHSNSLEGLATPGAYLGAPLENDIVLLTWLATKSPKIMMTRTPYSWCLTETVRAASLLGSCSGPQQY
ncbi:Proline-rich protein 23C [Heterocephalus glaber]|uniref:Proline-rich protein 23C n=1 Tax=Heterocephalus glaber TaxID=10181 RepID=G5AQA1_HETGA|nr:Proline-rich protein 23C [Heterocephalus glaber]